MLGRTGRGCGPAREGAEHVRGASAAGTDRRSRASGTIGRSLVGARRRWSSASCGGGGGEDDAGDAVPHVTPVERTATRRPPTPARRPPTRPSTRPSSLAPPRPRPAPYPPRIGIAPARRRRGEQARPRPRPSTSRSTSPLRGGLLPEPDATCLADALDKLPSSARRSLTLLVEDPLAWSELPDDDALVLAQAHLGCADDRELRTRLALTVLGFPTEEMIQCVELEWRGRLTSQNVAASLAYGNGLDDLAPKLSTSSSTRPSSADPIRRGGSTSSSSSSTGRSTQGRRAVSPPPTWTVSVSRPGARRVLTMPLLTLSLADHVRLDLPGRCGVDHAWPGTGLGAVRGECLADWGRDRAHHAGRLHGRTQRGGRRCSRSQRGVPAVAGHEHAPRSRRAPVR